MPELVKCPLCEKEIEIDSFYCDQCGEELKICPSGHGFKKGKVCTQCGTKLVEAKGNQKEQSSVVPSHASPTSPPAASIPLSEAIPSPASEHFPLPPQQQAAESTIRPSVAREPEYLINESHNIRLKLRDGAIIGRATGDYVSTFSTQGYVSGKHAKLQKNSTSGSWEIMDLDSTNGTFVNGKRLTPDLAFSFTTGDCIRIATLDFKVE